MMKSPKDIATEFKKRRVLSQSRLAKQYENTKRCQAFYSGDIMEYSDKVELFQPTKKKKNVLVKFNKVKPYVNAVKGFAAQNRRRAKYEARIENEQVQELFSQYANTIRQYARDNANSDQIETQQDGDMLINGYGVTESALSYGEGYTSHEIDGEMIDGRLDPLCVGWDTNARATNLLDRRYDYYFREYHIDEATKLFSNSKPEDFEESGGDTTDSRYEYFPYGGQYDKVAALEYTKQDEGLVRVYFYQWYDIETFYKAANPLYEIEDQQTALAVDAFLQMLANEYEEEYDFDPRAEILCFTKEMRGKLQEYFGEFMGEVHEFKRKVYYEAVLSGDAVFTAYKSISQQGFRRQFKTGDYDATNDIWVGMVNSMMEPATYYNKALTELMFTIATNSKGGVFAEESAIIDIVEFEKNYSKTDGVIVVNDGALTNGTIQEKKSPHVPTGLEDIVSIAHSALTDVNGFDATFMGSREFAEDTAAFQRQRIRQVVSLLACYFDSISLYQKTKARIELDLLRVFVENNQNMTVRMIGEDGKALFMRLQSKQLSAEYDVAMGEAPLSVQDKEAQATILTAIGDKLIMTDPASAKVVYATAIELMPLDFAMKQKIKQVLMPESDNIDPAYVKQLEEQVQALMSEMNQAQLAKIKSSVSLDMARAQEMVKKVRKTEADTVKVLEEAKRTALESDLARNTPDKTVTVNV